MAPKVEKVEKGVENLFIKWFQEVDYYQIGLEDFRQRQRDAIWNAILKVEKPQN